MRVILRGEGPGLDKRYEGFITRQQQRYRRISPEKESPWFFHRWRPPAYRIVSPVYTYYDPASFVGNRSNIPDIVWNATTDHLSLLSFAPAISFSSLFSSGYYETRFQRYRRTGVRKRSESGWKTLDVCPPGIVIFIGSQLFPRLFLLHPILLLLLPYPTVCFLPTARKSQRQWKYVVLYPPGRSSTDETFVWMSSQGPFDMSPGEITEYRQSIELSLQKITITIAEIIQSFQQWRLLSDL